MVAGAAERTLAVRHRALIDELRTTGLPDQPPYDTASAFRFACDPTASRDLADTSAVAAEAGVLVRAITEQPLTPPPPLVEAPASTMLPGSPVGPDAGGLDAGGLAGDLVAGDGGLSVLTRPAAAAAWEKADQGCRAVANGWHAEATELFLAAAEQTPTDPFAWFGAGLSASRLDPSAAATYFARASRYLLAEDPAGSVYTTIAAAGLMEQAGDLDRAVGLLEQRLDELRQPCPTILLHLARLGSESDARVAAVLLVDPLMEVDARALGLDRSGRATADRRARTELEVRRLDGSIAALRAVADGHPRLEQASGTARDGTPGAAPALGPGASADPGPRADADPSPGPSADPDPAAASSDLGLVRAEIELWQRRRACEAEVERARDAVGARQRARHAVESDLVAATKLAGADLGHRNTVPFFGFSMGAAFAVVALFVLGRVLAGAGPVLDLFTISVVWVSQVTIVVLTARQFLKAWWPRRAYAQAREVKATTIPDLVEQVSRQREGEFNLRRRYALARRDADLRMSRIVDRRRSLAPKRPHSG